MNSAINGVSVVIPAYMPDHKLLPLVKELIDAGFEDVIVVDDGGGDEFAGIFDELKAEPKCTVLTHRTNRGKGAALKTALVYYADTHPNSSGVVTADADGQHTVHDIVSCSEQMAETGKVILGSRDFSGEEVPPKSKFGNRVTSFVFRLFFGMKITDTQTGLRAFPRQYVMTALEASGDRYEYETNVLVLLKKRSVPYEELKIETVYHDNNKGSHFRPVRDSIRIYSTLLKYVGNSLASSLIDNLIFLILLHFLAPDGKKLFVFICCIISRTVAATVNFVINKKTVFGGEHNKYTVLRYAAVAVPMMLLSATFTTWVSKILEARLPIANTLIKVVIDTTLFFITFRVQNQWVFNSGKFKSKPEDENDENDENK